MRKNYSFFIIAVVVVLTIIVGAVIIDVSFQNKDIIAEPENSNDNFVSTQGEDDSEISNESSEKAEKKENSSKPESSDEASGFSYSSTSETTSYLEPISFETESSEVDETHHPAENSQPTERSMPISNKPEESRNEQILSNPTESSEWIPSRFIENSKPIEGSQSSIILPEVRLSDAHITINEGDTERIEIINSADGAGWHIDNSAVISFVSVDMTGVVVKANHSGTTILTANMNGTGKALTCTVTVIN